MCRVQRPGAVIRCQSHLPEPLSHPKVTLATFPDPSGVLVSWPSSGKGCLMARLELEDTHLGSNPGCHSEWPGQARLSGGLARGTGHEPPWAAGMP